MSAIFGKNTLDFPRMRSDVRWPACPWQWNWRFFPFLHVFAVVCIFFHRLSEKYWFCVTFATFATQILSGVIWGLISANMQFHVFLLFFYFPFFFRIGADFCEKCFWIVESNRFDGRTPTFFVYCGDRKAFFEKFRFLQFRSFAVFCSWFSSELARGCF